MSDFTWISVKPINKWRIIFDIKFHNLTLEILKYFNLSKIEMFKKRILEIKKLKIFLKILIVSFHFFYLTALGIFYLNHK